MIYNFDELEFKPISVGNFIHKDGIFNVKARPYASLSFRTKGTGIFEICGKKFEVKEGDTPEILQRRIMEEAEWKILPEAVKLFCEGRITVENNKVHIKGE